MPADIFVYAIVAAGLVLWLRNILGTRHGDERERSNPFAAAADAPADQAPGDETGEISMNEDLSPEEAISDLAANPTQTMVVDNKTAENGLLEIAAADKNFDVKRFLTGAQDAFVLIVESFAAADLETLKNLLEESVYNAFEGAIMAREEAGEVMEKEIHAIRRSEVLDARLDGKMAFVTLRFVADEMGATKNADGDVIDGDADKVSEMIDIWTFGRSVKSKDPKWLLYETRSDDPEDNEMIPNTDV